MKNFKSLICTVTIGLTLITQLAGPFAVYADDDTPPAPTEAPTIVTTQLPTDSPTDAVPAETPIPEITATDSPVETPSVSDSPKVDAIATATPLPQRDPQHHSKVTVAVPTRAKTAADILIIKTAIDVAPTEAPAPDASTTTADIVSTTTEPTLLETLPDNTNLVVLDQNGDPLSLATQQAADAIATADPVWCPDGVLPIPGLNGCTASYATMNDLLTGAGAYINNQNVNGTIWITFGAVGDVSPVIIQGLTYTNWANHSLTLQGGWSGTAGDPAIGSNSAFSVAIEIKNWNNNVTVNNITVSGATTNNGLNIYSDSTNIVPVASINNSNFSGNLYAGFWIEDAGSLSINNSSIGGNNQWGAVIKVPNVQINNSIFSNNNLSGIIVPINTNNSLTLSNSTFSGNQWGTYVYSSNSVTIDHSTFSGNDLDGIYVISDTVTVQNNSTFSGNPRSGLYISFAGAINITGGTIENNGTGLYVYCSQSLNFNQPLTSFANNGVDIIVDPTCPISITYAPAPLPLIIVAQKGQGEFELNCIGQDGFAVNLPNGDLVNIFCPVSGRAVINRVDNSTLPADLPAGYTYASAFALDILQQGAPIPVITEGGYIQASFVGQSLQPGNTYSILYWDDWKFENGNWVEHPESGSWVPLKDFLVGKNGLLKNFDLYPGAATDTRKIISGVKLVTKNGVQRVEVSANFPGTFALAQH